jgi:hypothetical protein
MCVEMDFSKRFPAEVILTGKNYSWSQKLDYERVSLRCRSCFETGHLATHCPKGPKKNRKLQKSTWCVGSNDGHQVLSKDCRQPPQVIEKSTQPDPPLHPTPLSQDMKPESIQKSEKETSSPQVSDEGLRIVSGCLTVVPTYETSYGESRFLGLVAALYTPGRRGINLQSTRCVLGSK